MTNFFGEKHSGLIFAADLHSLSENAKVLSTIADKVDVIKVGSPLLYSEGMRVIPYFADKFSKPVFADLKLADVPHTNAKIVDAVRRHGGAAIMVHGFVGPDGIQDSIDASRGELGIIVQLELTNPGGLIFTAPVANDMAKMAAGSDVYGMQAPGNRPERIAGIRRLVGDSFTIVCCGVGTQGGSHKQVLQAGGDYSIVGRTIYEATDPAKAIEEVLSR